MHAKLGPAHAPGAVGDAVGDRVPGANRYGAFEPRAISRPGVHLRCGGAAEAIAHDEVAHERGRWCRR
jgi:hypothetical protein